MVGRALSERVKLQERRRVDNTIMQHAIDEYLREQEKPDGVRKRGYRPIADKYGVSSSTLQALVNGGTSLSAFNATKRKLTHAEERVLVDWILESSDRALPPSLANIAVHANGILGGREVLVEPVGESWVPRFLDRYRDELQTHWSRPLATERARSLNKDAVKHWYELMKENVIDKGIKEHNIYGMDESGFPPANQGVQRVVGRRGTKVQHKAGSANRENVTVLVTICADGTALQPTIIFKGKRLLKKWGTDNVSGAS
jgi:transcriptional regulator with XRE-family HTH domain